VRHCHFEAKQVEPKNSSLRARLAFSLEVTEKCYGPES
jgi:hypothetical protein